MVQGDSIEGATGAFSIYELLMPLYSDYTGSNSCNVPTNHKATNISNDAAIISRMGIPKKYKLYQVKGESFSLETT